MMLPYVGQWSLLGLGWSAGQTHGEAEDMSVLGQEQ